jgi:riboflavin kinase / FMN adenylyltransferase
MTMRVIRHPRAANGPCAIAIGSFDGVHRGHAALLARLREAAATRSLPSAILTFEPLPREFFAPATAPGRLSSLRERLEGLAQAGVETVFVRRFDARFAAMTAQAFIEHLHRDLGARRVVVGRDFRFGTGRAGDVEQLAHGGRQLGFEVEVLDDIAVDGERISSTRVRAALAAGDFGTAARMLGRPYAITGRVVHGAKRGRQLGFPTANVRLARPRPALGGIYAVKCFGAATRGLEGVASLGTNPAVNPGGPATLEAFLFDFSDDLYGARLSIEFVKKLREEAHFASLDALAAQIRRDCDEARDLFRQRTP